MKPSAERPKAKATARVCAGLLATTSTVQPHGSTHWPKLYALPVVHLHRCPFPGRLVVAPAGGPLIQPRKKGQPPKGQTPNPKSLGSYFLHTLPPSNGQLHRKAVAVRLDHFFESQKLADREKNIFFDWLLPFKKTCTTPLVRRESKQY